MATILVAMATTLVAMVIFLSMIEFEVYNVMMYEPVVMVGDEFKYKTLVLIGMK